MIDAVDPAHTLPLDAVIVGTESRFTAGLTTGATVLIVVSLGSLKLGTTRLVAYTVDG